MPNLASRLSLLAWVLSASVFAQSVTKVENLLQLSRDFANREAGKREFAIEFARQNSIPVAFESDGVFHELKYILNGIPQYYISSNANSAISIATDEVIPGGIAGLGLTGTGITVREWDVGKIRLTHQEFEGRASMGDGNNALQSHSTHVAGTIMAAGIDPQAMGMASQANLVAFDWVDDNAEMAEEAAEGMLLSNHSYIFMRGWHMVNGVWEWQGDPEISEEEDYLFGFYDEHSQAWDQIAYDAPYYLVINCAGNDRDDGPGTYPADDGPFDCISQLGIGKNILTVGAVADVVGGYSGPADVVMTSFSSWGPADDGRIKPDISANGLALYSTYSTADDAYVGMSGTSMAAPSVTGSMALLQEHCENLNGNYMLAATLKALVIHTADEAGAFPGPDYEFGWGLMNTRSAADKISEDQIGEVMGEFILEEGETYSREVKALGDRPLKVTIVWTDVAGSPPEPQLDPIDPMLVNDLDLRITHGENIFYPWKLDRDNPAAAATNCSENNVDNVEVVFIEAPVADTYTIIVDHDGTLANGPQAFSMIISGIDLEVPPFPNFYLSNVEPTVLETVEINDLTLGNPSSWNWSFSGPGEVVFTDGTGMNSQNPSVIFMESGLYDITLLSVNSFGGHSIEKTACVNVQACEPCTSQASVPTYCWISNVFFNTIDNSSSESGYSDFTTVSTQILPGMSYNFSATVTSTGGANCFMGLFIDWDHNCDFTGPGEAYTVGVIGGSGTLDTEILVPEEVISGPVTMRVIHKYNAYPAACGSYTFGETEDYTLEILERSLDVRVLLEGPFTGQEMSAALEASIPQNPPYIASPWFYPGSEQVIALPNEDVVDWVLLELRDATSAGMAFPSKIIERQACLLLKDGSVRAPDGVSLPGFGLPVNDGLYLVLYHRNHLPVISNSAIFLDQGIYSYDFTSSVNQAYGTTTAHKQLAPNVWGMISGDGNADGIINENDKSALWNNEAGMPGYLPSDYNLDGQSDNTDKDDHWLPNLGKSSQVPE